MNTLYRKTGIATIILGSVYISFILISLSVPLFDLIEYVFLFIGVSFFMVAGILLKKGSRGHVIWFPLACAGMIYLGSAFMAKFAQFLGWYFSWGPYNVPEPDDRGFPTGLVGSVLTILLVIIPTTSIIFGYIVDRIRSKHA